jgi:hypothetical protein
MKTEICPICGKENKCANANGTDPSKCWCMKVKISKDVLEKLEKAKTMETGGCFCKSCVEEFSK